MRANIALASCDPYVESKYYQLQFHWEREREGDAERYDPYIYNIIAGYFAKYDKVIIVFLSLSIIGGEILEKK